MIIIFTPCEQTQDEEFLICGRFDRNLKKDSQSLNSYTCFKETWTKVANEIHWVVTTFTFFLTPLWVLWFSKAYISGVVAC